MKTWDLKKKHTPNDAECDWQVGCVCFACGVRGGGGQRGRGVQSLGTTRDAGCCVVLAVSFASFCQDVGAGDPAPQFRVADRMCTCFIVTNLVLVLQADGAGDGPGRPPL